MRGKRDSGIGKTRRRKKETKNRRSATWGKEVLLQNTPNSQVDLG